MLLAPFVKGSPFSKFFSDVLLFRAGPHAGVEHADAADDAARAGEVPELLGAGRGLHQGRVGAQEQVHLLHHQRGR